MGQEEVKCRESSHKKTRNPCILGFVWEFGEFLKMSESNGSRNRDIFTHGIKERKEGKMKGRGEKRKGEGENAGTNSRENLKETRGEETNGQNNGKEISLSLFDSSRTFFFFCFWDSTYCLWSLLGEITTQTSV